MFLSLLHKVKVTLENNFSEVTLEPNSHSFFSTFLTTSLPKRLFSNIYFKAEWRNRQTAKKRLTHRIVYRLNMADYH
jgi:hypothetical protein